jgi:hypothetical protein
MDDGFEQMPLGALQSHLLIADYFTGAIEPKRAVPGCHDPENVEIEVETLPIDNRDTLWIIGLQEDVLDTYTHNGVGYWVRPAHLRVREHGTPLGSYVRCYVGFSPESGKLLKLLGRSSTSKLSVWMESGPVTSILHIERTH